MRTYDVRIFVPTVCVIEAETEEEALAKVKEIFRELYEHDIRTWMKPLPEPQVE